MELYNYFRSSASYRVRIALALKGLDYEYKPVHLARNEQFTESYAAVSAARLVPILRDGEHNLTQSLAIIEYLEETHPAPPLLPAAPAERARVRGLAMDIACEAAIIFARRHADLAEEMAKTAATPQRREELQRIAGVCRRVPEHAPRTLHEALQTYWFVHLGTITELNGWDAMNPGHFDQHLTPFYENDLKEGILTRAEAKELMSCFFIKINKTTGKI